ncbi:MAG: hypothetical protein WC558_15020 [Patulibacter sp.]
MSDDPTPRRSLGVLWRRTYGASPLHLLLHLAGIALAAWALSQAFDPRYSASAFNLLLWLVAGLVLHDLIALPLYVVADRVARAAWSVPRWLRGRAASAPVLGTVRGNGHVRFPLVVSAVLLLVYLPNILGKAPKGHFFSTGLPEQPDFAARWLLITAGLFLLSALIYAARSVRSATAAAAARRSSPR